MSRQDSTTSELLNRRLRLVLIPLLAAAPNAVACLGSQALSQAPPACPSLGNLPTSASATASASAPQPQGPALSVKLTPVPLPHPSFSLAITARGAPTELVRWTLARGALDRVQELVVRDANGDIAAERRPLAQGVEVLLARPPVGAVTVSYRVVASEQEEGKGLSSTVAVDHCYASGELTLLLPSAWDDRAVPVELEINSAAAYKGVAASSFGIGGQRARTVTGRFLRRTSFLAGSLGTAVLDAYEGHDEAAWHGYTAFDARGFAAEFAELRTAMRQFFAEPEDTPTTLLLVAHKRPQNNLSVSRRAGSVVGFVGIDEKWAGPLRITFAQELAHAWIGEQLWIGSEDPAQEAETIWFTGGLTRHYARDLLRRFGQISPAEVRNEVQALISLQATSPLAQRSNAELARTTDPHAYPLLVARGALYALRVDAQIRSKSQGKRSLDTVVLALLKQARAEKKALPLSAWKQALSAELGPAEADAFEALVLQASAPITLPEGALGRCFRSVPARYSIFGLGFDLNATLAASPRTLQGLEPKGPAARAGLRNSDVLSAIEVVEGNAELPVKLTIQRDGREERLTYRPVAGTVAGQGWDRIPGLRDELCSQ